MSTITTTPLTIKLPQGGELYGERTTQASAPATTSTIILIHGLGGSTGAYHPIYASLTAGLPSAALVAYDWAGHGRSVLPSYRTGATPLTIDDLTNDIDAVIASAAPAGPISIVAHSGGTVLASRFLLSSSPSLARVTHTVFLAGPLDGPYTAEMTAVQQQTVNTLESDPQGLAKVAEAIAPLLVGATTQKTKPEVAGDIKAALVGMSQDGYTAAIKAFARFGIDPASALRWEGVPGKVLVLGGEEDVMVPRAGLEKITGRIAGSKLIMLERVGHMPTLESPDAVTDALVTFLKA